MFLCTCYCTWQADQLNYQKQSWFYLANRYYLTGVISFIVSLSGVSAM